MCCLHVYLCVCLFICLSGCPSVCLSVCLCLSEHWHRTFKEPRESPGVWLSNKPKKKVHLIFCVCFRWLLGGEVVVEQSSNVFLIPSIRRQLHGKEVTCEATNKAGTTQQTTTLDIACTFFNLLRLSINILINTSWGFIYTIRFKSFLRPAFKRGRRLLPQIAFTPSGKVPYLFFFLP